MDAISGKDWKQSLGFPINYESGQSSDDNFDANDVVFRRFPHPRSSSHLLADGGDGADADLLGTTPPRARIRDKEKRRSMIDSDSPVHRVMKDSRRNTMDNLYADDERTKKRVSLKLGRSRERDWKMIGSLPSPTAPANPTLVESCNRFMSLSSRLKSGGEWSVGPAAGAEPHCRVSFHRTFSLLISMGSGDKACRRTISREEQVWQNELKDLIWLELQAKIAGRTLAQQDAFLCAQRDIVPAVIKNINDYRFVNTSPCQNMSDDAEDPRDDEDYEFEDKDWENDGADIDFENGCLSFDCQSCSQSVGKALREVGTLIDSFSNACTLYPSSKAMTADHPLIATQLFKNRVKALCLWFNTALHLRMKLLVMRRLHRSVTPAIHSRQSDSSSLLHNCQVRFDIDGSPSDSGNSNDTDSRSDGRDDVDSAGEKVDPSIILAEASGASTPEVHLEGASSAPGSTQDSGYSGEDPYELGPLDELTAMCLLDKCQLSPYRHHLSEMLKTQGLRSSLMFIQKLRQNILKKVYITFQMPNCSPPAQDDEEVELTEGEHVERDLGEEELRRYGCWSPEALAMRLPSYRGHFLLLSTLGMEVVHEYLALRLDTRPTDPSCLTIRQMIHELKEGIEIAADIRGAYVRNVSAAIRPRRPPAPLRAALRAFDCTVHDVLKQYLSYLTKMSEGQFLPRCSLDAEWAFTARLATRVKHAAELAPRCFTDIVCNQIARLQKESKEMFNEITKMEGEYPVDTDDVEKKRAFLSAICRETQLMFSSERDRSLQSVQFARALANRIPPTANMDQLRERIFKSMMSVRDCVARQTEIVAEKSNLALDEPTKDLSEGIIARIRELLLQAYRVGFELHKELYRLVRTDEGETSARRPVSLQPPRRVPAPPPPRRRRPDTILVHSINPLVIHKELHRFASGSKFSGFGRKSSVLNDDRPRLVSAGSNGDELEERLLDEQNGVGQHPPATRAEWSSLTARAIIKFAQGWMTFVTQRCDRGRGLRPRWASQGLEFLMLACDPNNTRHLTDQEFEELKQQMDECISHVVGSRAAARPEPPPTTPRPRRLAQSPSPQPASAVPPPPSPPVEPDPLLDYHGFDTQAHSRRVYSAVLAVDEERDAQLRARRAVGRLLHAPVDTYEPPPKQLNFKWQRGLKIGQGSFGKVYTVINSETGQLLALKEVVVAAGDRRAAQRAAHELQLLRGVTHPHLVTYYGCELHREKMLLFMELCVEGSLEALVVRSGPLDESCARRYTRQLTAAVRELHARGIAHRDIKSGNIFLTNEGNCLKLGDFGCAVKIRSDATAVGELQGTVGTQAYMAPEVFMKSGHGRAADIWSVGCVVTEMASGVRPFVEYDSNYQIMFVVGMGGCPAIPPSLSPEGRDFCARCFTREPELRPRAGDLFTHHFLMVKTDDDCNCEPTLFVTKI